MLGGGTGDEGDMTVEQNKLLIQRLVEEAVNQGHPDVLAEVADGEFARAARQWVGPFREAFPDFSMEIVDLVAEEEKVAAHFRCSGTHLGEWMGRPPSACMSTAAAKRGANSRPISNATTPRP